MKFLPFACLSALAWSGVAHAQSVPEGVGVADRARPDYYPVGGRIGSFFLLPTLTANAVATDNVRAANFDRMSDVYALFRADARLRSNLPRHALNLRVFADQTVHARNSREDATQFGATLDGQLDVNRETAATMLAIAEHRAEDRTSYNSVLSARSPVRYDHYAVGGLIKRDASPIAVSAGVRFDRFDFQDARSFAGATITQQFRDVDNIVGTAAVTYTIHPGFKAVVRASADKASYALSPLDPRQPGGLDRDSSGIRVEGGVRFELTSLLYGEARIGYLTREYADARLRDAAGLSFGADLLWNVTPLTTLRIRADRGIEAASSADIAGNRRTEFQANVDHELLRNLILSASGRHAEISPLGPIASSSEYGVTAGARYLMSRLITLRAGYVFNKRGSTDPLRGFSENRATAGINLSF